MSHLFGQCNGMCLESDVILMIKKNANPYLRRQLNKPSKQVYCIRPPLNKKVFSCPPAGWAKKGRLGLFFFMIFEKRFFFSIFLVHSSQ